MPCGILILALARSCRPDVCTVDYLATSPLAQGSEAPRAISIGVRTLSLLCRERDNIAFDHIYESSDSRSARFSQSSGLLLPFPVASLFLWHFRLS